MAHVPGHQTGTADAAERRAQRRKTTPTYTADAWERRLTPPAGNATMQEAYNAEFGAPQFGSGTPGASGREARQNILNLMRGYGGAMRSTGADLRGLRAQQAEAAERMGSRMAQRGGTGGGAYSGLGQLGVQNLMDAYRAGQARLGAQRAGLRTGLLRDVSGVRNLLDQKNFEAAVARAASIANYWNKVIEHGTKLTPEMQAVLQPFLGAQGGQ